MASNQLGNVLTQISRRKTGTVATLIINRPEKLNVLSSQMMEMIPKAVSEVTEHNKDLLAIILTGAGSKAFIAGADINELATLTTPAIGRGFIKKMHGACKALRDCPVPVIGKLNGHTLGGGLELALGCDFRVTVKNALFGMPEVKVGLPSVIESAYLPGLIGWGRTKRLLFLGDTISAHEAEKWGLVEKVVDDHQKLDEAVEDWLVELDGSGTKAVRIQKELHRRWEEMGPEAAMQCSIDLFGTSFEAEAEGGGQTEPERMTREILQKLASRKSGPKI
jgi:enoyl-CoA hydratase